jgi:hypothetical protein
MTTPLPAALAGDVGSSNRLPVLAAEIREANEACIGAARTAVERAREAGVRLIEAKELLSHGQWLPWLESTGVAPRTAQDYMRLARIAPLKYATVAHLGIRAALKVIARREPSPFAELETALDYIEEKVERDELSINDLCTIIEWGRVAEGAAFTIRTHAERYLGFAASNSPSDLSEEEWARFVEGADEARYDAICSRMSAVRARVEALCENATLRIEAKREFIA